MKDAVARTIHGPVRGVVEDGIVVFKGVRYGADTATTRFAAPAEPEAWSDIQTTDAYGASSPQARTGRNPGGFFGAMRGEPLPTSEDCLFLNVWTPALGDGGARPVMVWFHGGGFASGSGSSKMYDGARLARRGDVVVVTVNHRLNVFGYLALEHHGAGFEDSSAAGVLDMVQALTWVRASIEAFGGDPKNVTIFGESGGGAKVSALMSMAAARGLFHRAIVQSGPMIRFPDRDFSRAEADKVIANLGLTAPTLSRIRTLPTEAIYKALAGTGAAGAPTLDGRNFTRHPFDPDAPPAGRDVPMLIGTNRTENSLFLGGSPHVFELTWESLATRFARTWPNLDVAAIIAGYRELQPDSNPTDIYLEATTDARFLAATVMQAERKAQQGGAPAWQYLFNWDTPVDGGKWRSPHALDIPFVFDNVSKTEGMTGIGAEQQRVADIMADTWIAFARCGDPNNPAIPRWPSYDLDHRPVMVLDATPAVVNDARGAQRAMFQGSGDAEAYGNRYQRSA